MQNGPEDTSTRRGGLQKAIMLPRMPGVKSADGLWRIRKPWRQLGKRPTKTIPSSQNKNWCLFSSRVSIVKSQTISTEDITLKCFQPGLTFMSADSFHHGVEQEMKSRPGGAVYDFDDFLSVVGNSNPKKVEGVELNNEGIGDGTGGHSAVKSKK
ncbi:hypothetical protein KUCAC02_029573 [Chaenocephalus aceratus]|nr:hypothetical protein KUCAC02_029573 [Chaenocephalus aceratus]